MVEKQFTPSPARPLPPSPSPSPVAATLTSTACAPPTHQGRPPADPPSSKSMRPSPAFSRPASTPPAPSCPTVRLTHTTFFLTTWTPPESPMRSSRIQPFSRSAMAPGSSIPRVRSGSAHNSTPPPPPAQAHAPYTYHTTFDLTGKPQTFVLSAQYSVDNTGPAVRLNNVKLAGVPQSGGFNAYTQFSVRSEDLPAATVLPGDERPHLRRCQPRPWIYRPPRRSTEG